MEKKGFSLNPYDQCVANKIIEKKQCTLAWYVDDNKLSHVDKNVLSEVIEIAKRYFGELKVTWGKIHKFLGININIRDDKKIELDMVDHLVDAIKKFGESI